MLRLELSVAGIFIGDSFDISDWASNSPLILPKLLAWILERSGIAYARASGSILPRGRSKISS